MIFEIIAPWNRPEPNFHGIIGLTVWIMPHPDDHIIRGSTPKHVRMERLAEIDGNKCHE